MKNAAQTKDRLLLPLVSRTPLWLTANHISYLRILACIILWIALATNHLIFAFIIFLFASFSDAFDGAVARHRNQESSLGRILDPVADKLLFFIVFLYLGIFLPRHLFIAIILIELITVFAALIFPLFMNLNSFVKTKPVIQANVVGKYKITVYYAGLCVLFLIPLMPSAGHAANFIFEIGLVLSFANFGYSLISIRKH